MQHFYVTVYIFVSIAVTHFPSHQTNYSKRCTLQTPALFSAWHKLTDLHANQVVALASAQFSDSIQLKVPPQ